MGMNLIENEYIQEYAGQLWDFPIRLDGPTPPEQHEAIIAICNSALALNLPNDWTGAFLHARGAAFYFLKRFEEALQDFNEWIRLEPKHPYPYETRSWVYEAMGNLDAARGDMEIYDSLIDEYMAQAKMDRLEEQE